MKKLRKLAAIILCLAIGLQIGAIPAMADELEDAFDEIAVLASGDVVDSGTCGANLTWKLTDDGVLTVRGNGAMKDYAYRGSPFYQHNSIKSVVLEKGVTSISYAAFSGCTGLTSVTVPNSVTCIDSDAFSYCTSLTSVKIPDSVISIGGYAFYGCTGLTSVTIPIGVTSIGNYAFYGCTNLTNIYCEAATKPSGWSSRWKSYCPATVHWNYRLFGDLDGNGIVTEDETIEILYIVRGMNTLTAEQQTASDFNHDNIIDVRDFNYIYYKANNPD